MAQQQNLKTKIHCAACFDLLKDPVTLPCEHSYCMTCIKSYWDKEDRKETHSISQCRRTFTLRPAVVKNTPFASLVEDLKKTGLQAAPAVACDLMVSYCNQQLQPHYESPAFENHKLDEPPKRLQENICAHPSKDIKIFCRTDQQCICYPCANVKHEGHNTVLASDERRERQIELLTTRQKIQQRIQDRVKDVKMLQCKAETIKCSADKAVKKSEKIFSQLVCLIKNRSADVTQWIRSRQKTDVSVARELQEKLQQEIAKLRRKDTELEQLSHTEDHVEFLHSYPSLSYLNEYAGSSSFNVHVLSNFNDAIAAVSALAEKIQDILDEEWVKISLTKNEEDVFSPQAELLQYPQQITVDLKTANAEESLSKGKGNAANKEVQLYQAVPKDRTEFLQYSCQTILDPNTANMQLLISEGNRKVTVIKEKQLYSSHPERFTDMFQVLSKESLSGRHYWEVERSRFEVSVAVTYKDISRAGYESGFGNDDKSWALECFDNSCEFRHNSINTFISGPQTTKIGVYLDHRAGILSFYSVSETMTLLHSVQTTFTQPLFQGLGVFGSYGDNPAAEFCKLE